MLFFTREPSFTSFLGIKSFRIIRLPPTDLNFSTLTPSYTDTTNQVADAKHNPLHNKPEVINRCNGVSDFVSLGLVGLAAVDVGNFACSTVGSCSAQKAGSTVD